MGGDVRLWVLRFAAVLGVMLALAAGAWMWLRWEGTVDPTAALIGAASALLALAANRQARAAQRVADTDVEAWADRLAAAVLTEETAQRTQLLAGEGTVIDVDFVFHPVPGAAPLRAGRAGSLAEVVAYFRGLDAPERLVITGAAGSGKTVLAVQLIIGLLTDARPGDPVPVRISAAGWDPDIPVADWLTAHLVATFALRPVTAQALVAAGQILPVIDGLDEMDEDPAPGFSSRAGRALRALNEHQIGLRRSRLVLTCRTGQYDALLAYQVRAKAAARIELSAVGGDKAWRFIQSMTDQDDPERWQPVLEALTQAGGHVMADALNTPWRLTLAAAVYEERDSRTGRHLRDPATLTTFTGVKDLHRHLLARYIPARVAAVTPEYAPREVHTWLAVLAAYLHANETRPPFAGRTLSSTDLVPHELWPLAGPRPRFIGFVFALILGLAMAVIVLIQVGVGFAPRQVMGAGPILLTAFFAYVLLWRDAWPEPGRLDLDRLRTPAGRKYVVSLLGFGLVMGLVMGFAAVLISGVGELLAGAAAVCCVVGLMVGVGVTGIRSGVDPRGVVRADVAVWLAFAFTFALASSIGVGRTFGYVPMFSSGLAGGLVIPIALDWGGRVGLRYLGFLLAVRGRLPWRLGRFLHWCYAAGLLRISGIAYQFRHRELQDYLATRPTPEP